MAITNLQISLEIKTKMILVIKAFFFVSSVLYSLNASASSSRRPEDNKQKSKTSSSSKPQDDLLKKLEIQVGETRPIHLKDVYRVHVNRKGIIHLIQEQEGRWMMTGIRGGMVVIEAKVRKAPPRIIYVKVTQTKSNHAQKSKDSQESEMKDLEHPTTACSPSNAGVYHVKTYIELKEVMNQENDQLQLKANAELDVIKNAVQRQASLQLIEPNLNLTKRTLATPNFFVSACTSASLKSGGAIPITQRDSHDNLETDWHEYGLNFSILLHEVSRGLLDVDLDFQLTNPQADPKAFSLNQIQTKLKIPTSKKTQVGSLDLKSLFESSESFPILSSIPIIGPLVGNDKVGQSNATLDFSIEITKAAKNAE